MKSPPAPPAYRPVRRTDNRTTLHGDTRMKRTFLSLMIASLAAAAPATAQQVAQPGYRDPGTSTLIGVAIPGGGQLYSGETGKGAALLGIALGGVTLGLTATASSVGVSCDDDFTCEDDTNYLPMMLGYAAFLGSWIYGIMDADDSAERMNAKRGITAGFTSRLSPVIAGTPKGGTAVGLSLTF